MRSIKLQRYLTPSCWKARSVCSQTVFWMMVTAVVIPPGAAAPTSVSGMSSVSPMSSILSFLTCSLVTQGCSVLMCNIHHLDLIRGSQWPVADVPGSRADHTLQALARLRGYDTGHARDNIHCTAPGPRHRLSSPSQSEPRQSRGVKININFPQTSSRCSE